jgi:predicted HD phosphohydrolase
VPVDRPLASRSCSNTRSAELVAAALLHDLPEFAPAGVDVKTFLSGRYGEHTTHVVLALAAEH